MVNYKLNSNDNFCKVLSKLIKLISRLKIKQCLTLLLGDLLQ